MKIYLKGSLDDAKKFAYDWAARTDRVLIRPKEKIWHNSHPLDLDSVVYFVTEKQENPNCDVCTMILHGHKGEGKAVRLRSSPDNDVTVLDFVKHWRVVADKKNPIVGKMLAQRTPKEIIGSYLYIDYKERKLI